jgi:hypothetical protein
MKSIVCVTAGWVFVGEYAPATTTTPASISNAAVIRKWGTTAGLGQLALEGMQKDTILDPCGSVVLSNPQAVLFVIPAPGM